MTEPIKPPEEQAPGTNPGPKAAATPQPANPGPKAASAPQAPNPGPKAAAIPPPAATPQVPNPGPQPAATPTPPQAPPGAVNPNPTPGFPASATLPPGQQAPILPGQPVAQPPTVADVKAAEKAQTQREAQAEHDARAAEEGVVAGKGGGTVEVEAPKDSTNKDGTRKQKLFVSADGITTYATGPGQAAVAHDPDPATQMFGAPEDREDAAKE
jgi:hypothetical protein